VKVSDVWRKDVDRNMKRSNVPHKLESDYVKRREEAR